MIEETQNTNETMNENQSTRERSVRELAGRLFSNDPLDQPVAPTHYWCRTPGMIVDRLSGKKLKSTPSTQFAKQEWYSTLVEVLSNASNMLHKNSLRGPADTLVASPNTHKLIETMVSFQPEKSTLSTAYFSDAVKTGTLYNWWTTYEDTYKFLPEDTILLCLESDGSEFAYKNFAFDNSTDDIPEIQVVKSMNWVSGDIQWYVPVKVLDQPME